MDAIIHFAVYRSSFVSVMSNDDEITTFTARQEVLDRLAQATMPAGVNPGLGPDYSPTGQIMFYTLKSTNPKYDVIELKTLQD
jgi:cobalt-zinc-cadmium resistance protein CzcA